MPTTHAAMADQLWSQSTRTFSGDVPTGSTWARVRADRSNWRAPFAGDVIAITLALSEDDGQTYTPYVGFTAASGDFYPSKPLSTDEPGPPEDRVLESWAERQLPVTANPLKYQVTVQTMAPLRTRVEIDWS